MTPDGPEYGKVIELALSGETERSSSNTMNSNLTQTLPAASAQTLVQSSLALDKREDGQDQGTEKGEDEKVQAEEGEGSGVLTGLKLYLCFGAFMLAVFVRLPPVPPAYARIGLMRILSDVRLGFVGEAVRVGSTC